MASGVAIADAVVAAFNDMKVRKAQAKDEERKKRRKAVMFRISDDEKQIIIDEGREILVGDLGDTVDDPYMHFVSMLPLKDCRYALYDATFETKETRKEVLVFVMWAPDEAPLKSKMIYASTKEAIKKKFTGIMHELQVNAFDEVKDRSNIIEKLGGSSVVSFEGKPV